MSVTVFDLDTPVTSGGVEYNKLEARVPKGKDLRLLANAEKDPIGVQFKFLASVCNVPPAVFEELFLPDLRKLQAWMSDFLSDKQT